MNGYIVHSWSVFALAALLLAATIAAGFWLTRLRSLLACWTLAFAATVGMERLTAHEPAGLRMLFIIAALFFGMKAVAAVAADPRPRLSFPGWLGFALLWPGMRPGLFTAERRDRSKPDLWRHGFLCLLAGAGLILLARLLAGLYWPESGMFERWLITLPALVGLSLILHFGIFNLLAAGWSHYGVAARPLFRAPLAASSLADFWSRRWNLAFVEMTTLVIYRPLASRLGRTAASFAAFLFSGLLHEAAISLPVGAGYGWPLIYFLMHGSLVGVERNLERIGNPVESWGAWRHVWTLAWLALPLPLLFHEPFLAGAVWPLLGR